jgi:hypothetical protein
MYMYVRGANEPPQEGALPTTAAQKALGLFMIVLHRAIYGCMCVYWMALGGCECTYNDDIRYTFTECRKKTQTAECAYCNVGAIDEE